MVNNEEEMRDNNGEISEKLKLMVDIDDVKKRQERVSNTLKVMSIISPVLGDDPQVAHMYEIIEDEKKRIDSKINDIEERCKNFK